MNETNFEWDEKQISWQNALLLGKQGVVVPQELIDYEDNKTDFSDIQPITPDDIKNGAVKRIMRAEIPIKPEIGDWIKHEHIDFNRLMTDLLDNFYKTVKTINKNVAM